MLAERVKAASGIHIDPAKLDFIHLRVSRRLRTLNLNDFDAYLERLDADMSGEETQHLVEAVTTHTTSFFREAAQYHWLAEEGVAQLADTAPGSAMCVWSAAASIGAELWSAAILLAERTAAGRPPAQWRLIGTDISERAMHRARRAIYAQDEIEGLSPARIEAFLFRSRQLRDGQGRPLFQVGPALRRRAEFVCANLLDPASLPAFTADIAFLRNVLIYFDRQTQSRVVNNVLGRLRPGGVLLVGHSESLPRHELLEPIRPTIYRRL